MSAQLGKLRESLDSIALLVQQGQGIGHPLMHKDDFQQLVLWLLADIYLRLPHNTQSRSLRNAFEYHDPGNRKKGARRSESRKGL